MIFMSSFPQGALLYSRNIAFKKTNKLCYLSLLVRGIAQIVFSSINIPFIIYIFEGSD